MRIGVVTTSFPRHAGDYAGSFVGDRVLRLLADGHSVDVIAAGDGGAAGEIEHPGLAVARIASHPSPATGARGPALFYGAGAPEVLEGGGPAIWLAAARFTAALATAVRERAHHFDAVESHWLVPSALAALAGAPAGRHRAYAHSGDVALLERIPFGRTIARRLVRARAELHFVSDELRARFSALAGARSPVGAVTSLLPSPTSAADWAPRAGVDLIGRRQLGLARPTVLAVGRLVPIKGHDRLLRACARVQAVPGAGTPLEVVILGDGPERARLARLAHQLGVDLRLPGFVPRAEVARWLRACDVYVQPSIRLPNGRGEGAPFATAEARAVGIPVLVDSDVSRLAEALRGRFHAIGTGV
ncbi:MAG TPA: glycosyltransferase [Polyangia bacterium]|jgi:glycosyltransferase involved in cell wall biosynthesis